MPELPEVELVARSLDRLVAGRRIVAARLLQPDIAPETTPRAFARALRGQQVDGVGRRGKLVVFAFAGGLCLLTHLRMTGRFLLLPPDAVAPKHTHAVFYLDDERRLVFNDQRRFGRMRVVTAAELPHVRALRVLAPEPLSAEFTPAYLRGVFARTRRTLKEVLLDQTKVTGLGNIYAAEVMFRAGLHPRAVAATLNARRLARLHAAILAVLGESLAHGSTMNVNPEDIDGSYYDGGYQGRWHVYDRAGEPCGRCATPIRRIVQAKRSTYFCPRCQRLR
ncbi:MAG TPA: bifunctional DNA-formamidopyrimidine glycosylase/DNA-(apurinic or apyrimidinic site) lyase [Pyrinomonadaceae bacterium]|jgi:formamidopyrimidine-DNA glycosylase